MDYEGLSVLEYLRAWLLGDSPSQQEPRVMPLSEAVARLRRVPGNRLALFSVVQHVEDALCARSDIGASPLALQLVTVLSFQIRQLVSATEEALATGHDGGTGGSAIDPGSIFTAIDLACAKDDHDDRFGSIRQFLPSRENAAFWIRNFGRAQLSVEANAFVDACVREIPDVPDARAAEAAAAALAQRVDLNGDGRVDAAEFAVACPAFVGDELRQSVDALTIADTTAGGSGGEAGECRRCCRLQAELTLERRRNELLRQRIRRLERPPGSTSDAPSMVRRQHFHSRSGIPAPHIGSPSPTVGAPRAERRTGGDVVRRAGNAASMAELESGRLRRLADRSQDFAPVAKGHTDSTASSLAHRGDYQSFHQSQVPSQHFAATSYL